MAAPSPESIAIRTPSAAQHSLLIVATQPERMQFVAHLGYGQRRCSSDHQA
jgi:hypothetical protein